MNLLSDTTVENVRKERNYTFKVIDNCNMCGAPTAEARLLGTRLDKSQGRSPRGKTGIAVTVCRCRNCGLTFANPLPIPRSIADHYEMPPDAYWRTVNYDPPQGHFSRQIEALKRLLPFEPGMSAIDVGLGLGKEARVLEAAGFRVHGIEPSETFYNKALNILGGDTTRFKCSSIEDAEFPEASFDFVSFGAVLEHLYDPSGAIAKAMQWLRPGGIAFAEVPNARHLVARIINAYYRAIGTSFVTNTSPMHVPFHLYEFDLKSFEMNSGRNGYEIAEHWVDVASIYNIPRVLHPPLRAYMARSGTGMQLSVFLRKRG